MSFSDVEVVPMPPKTAMEMVVDHHYSGRKVGSRHCFGIMQGGYAIGCVVYSQPASYTLCNGVCGKEFRSFVLELSRLVIIRKIPNLASHAIGRTLKALGDAVVVSYADCNGHVGHVGYVYQATNWLYTGQGTAEPKWVHPETGEVVSYTRRHIDLKAKKLGMDWRQLVREPQVGKHRYVTFTGSRSFRKRARAALRYEVRPYPKGLTMRHPPIRPVRTLWDHHAEAT